MQDVATIRIPATTANLGPGFDCLGIALHLYNRVTVERSRDSARELTPMANEAAAAFFHTANVAPFPFHCHIDGEVPRSRGLGSSVTVRLGILHGLNGLTGNPLCKRRLFEICAALEGHPDNAAPGAYGGFVVSSPGTYERFEVDESLEFVLLIPPFEVATPDARRVLPPQVDRVKAARNVGNACRITAAFASHRYEGLRGAFGDWLHQPFREPLIPFLPKVIAAGENAGALGGFLSGSGSTICCVTMGDGEEVAMAMQRACADKDAYTIRTRADNRGAIAVEE
ncbi:MAG TPA: homoserine kinase [Chthoniobacteraceae bacterium]|jgi:homoserine kinase|nr:homoserine kinase [Chthoniobacteraceae bacterium]